MLFDNTFKLYERQAMNKTILTLALVLTLPLTAMAFPGGDQDPEGRHGKRIERLTKELNLTGEQKTKVEIIFQEQHEKFKAIHEETQTKLSTVLSPEQITKMEELKKQHKEKWMHKKGMEKPE